VKPPVTDFVDAYAVLGVRPGASQAELKAAHRRLVRRHHPDLVPLSERPAATRRVQQINVAYGLVRDPSARARYDRVRRAMLAVDVRSSVDQALAAQWEALAVAAGRWAAGWWRRARRRAARAALRARRAGLGVVGRVVWLLSSVVGGVVGLAVAVAAQRLLDVDGSLTPVAGLLAGILVGSQRGWHRRLRLAGFAVDSAMRWIGLALAAAAISAALWLDSIWRAST
jgi:hypothetical protein